MSQQAYQISANKMEINQAKCSSAFYYQDFYVYGVQDPNNSFLQNGKFIGLLFDKFQPYYQVAFNDSSILALVVLSGQDNVVTIKKNNLIFWVYSSVKALSLIGCTNQFNGLISFKQTQTFLALCGNQFIEWQQTQNVLFTTGTDVKIDQPITGGTQYIQILKLGGSVGDSSVQNFILVEDNVVTICNYSLGLVQRLQASQLSSIPYQVLISQWRLFYIDSQRQNVYFYEILNDNTLIQRTVIPESFLIQNMSTSPDHQYLVYSDQTSLYVWQYNQLFCQTGFMWNSALNFCVMCLYYCQSCSKSISQCDSCQPGRNNRYNIDNNCQCLQGYFNDGNLVCKQCPYFCQNCSQVTNGQVSCLSCPKDSFRNDNNSCTCQDGYYDTGITNCQKCDQTCLTCSSSSTNCVTCDPNSFRKLDASNKCICIDGYQEYQPPQIKCVSSKCSSTCDTCSQPQNPQACLTCLSNRTLVQISNTKVCQCNQRFYEDSSFICQPCDESCLTCNGNQSDNCLTCDISLNRVIDHLSSTCICKDGYYEQGGLCVQCDQTCQTCSGSGPQSCLSCIQNQNRNLSQNYQCICNQGYFSVDNNQVCKKCADNCQICDNFQPLKCKVCLPNLNRKLNTQNGNCDCQDGYFQVGTNSLCSKCDEQCKKCSISSNNCLSCSDPLKIIQGSNCICQEGYFQQEKSRLCLKCISNCLKCKDQKYCIQCKQNFELSKNNQCVQVIPSTIPKETVKQVSNSTQTTVYTSVGSTVAGSILLSSFQPNSSIATQLLLLQKFNFMLLINISYPQLLHEFFLIFGGSSPITSLYKFNIIDKYIIKNNDDPVYISDQFKQEDVSDSILKNSGGCVVIIIIFWLISLPFIVQYKKNTTILNAEEIRSTSTKIIKNVSEDYYPYLLVLIHQVLSLILFFSVFLQISAFIKFNPLSDNYFIPKLILLTIVGIYIFFILGKTTLIVNSIVNYEQDGILHSTEKIEQQIYSNVNLNQKGNTFFRRNYKLTQITIENILIPIFIIFVGFDSKIQLSLCLGFYVLLFILTAVTIPMKYFIDNLFLMLDQCCWIILYATILFIAYKIELIPDLNQMSNTDLQIFTTLSWVGVGCCIIILLLNPIYLIAQLIIQRKELKSSIKEICVKIKQIFSKKQPQDQNNISNYDNVSLYDFTLRNTSKLWDRSTLHKQQMLEQYKSIRQLQSNSFSIFSNQPSINQVKKIRLNKQVEIYRKQEIETHSKFNSIQQPIQEQKQENQKSNQKK